VAFRSLDSVRGESYLRLIPIHRLTGGALVRASAFRLEGFPLKDHFGGIPERVFLATRWGGGRPVELKEG